MISSFFIVLMLLFANCQKETTPSVSTSSNTTTNSTGNTGSTGSTTTGLTASQMLELYKKTIYGASSITLEGDYIVVKSTGLPDHKSPYYQGTQWASTKYEAYNGTAAFSINPNRIAQQNLTFRIPASPTEASTKSATPGGAIGVSLNGVPFFNQYAAGNSPLTNEIVSFDQYAGHPQQQGSYHYHIEPYYLTKTKGNSALLGFLLDGFPVYGPVENGKTLKSADLDAYHGHKHATTDFPNGIYHYHITADAPYLNGSGFFGNRGTVSQ
ncbi:MAG: YHYH protein [Saprospiraceae bacterium]|nr:YHYH protein [Saprospiraceae bacterium]